MPKDQSTAESTGQVVVYRWTSRGTTMAICAAAAGMFTSVVS